MPRPKAEATHTHGTGDCREQQLEYGAWVQAQGYHLGRGERHKPLGCGHAPDRKQNITQKPCFRQMKQTYGVTHGKSESISHVWSLVSYEPWRISAFGISDNDLP